MSCLKCLKYTMCVVNFFFFVCGATLFGLGIYLHSTSKYTGLIPSFQAINFASALFIIGIFVTCVSFLGFFGALKENRCLLISFFILLFLLMLAELVVACLLLMYEQDIDSFIVKELTQSLNQAINKRKANETINEWDLVQTNFKCCGVNNATDWGTTPPVSCCDSCTEGCYAKLKTWFDQNILSTGIGVIIVCSIEVLGMCFSMTLFCHISKSGLGYK